MIKELLTELKMFGASENLELYLKKYEKREDFVIAILKAEKEKRKNAAIKRRIKYAAFPYKREWSEIDCTYNPDVEFEKIKLHLEGGFLKDKMNLCFVGAPGTGKTHSAIAIGRNLCRHGVSVKFYTAVDLVTALEEAQEKKILSKLLKKLVGLRLMIIDELGYVPFSKNGARLLFDVFSKRYERGATIVTTNLAFDKWTEIFGSVELTSALIDRFTHRSEIYVFKGESVRFQQAKNK